MVDVVNLGDESTGQSGHNRSVLLLRKLFRVRAEEPEVDQWSAFWDDDENRFNIDLWTDVSVGGSLEA